MFDKNDCQISVDELLLFFLIKTKYLLWIAFIERKVSLPNLRNLIRPRLLPSSPH